MSTGGFDANMKEMLEDLFEMRNGYVLDFSNGSFASFVEDSIGFNPYDRYVGSKATILREIWRREPPAGVARLNRDLLHRWELNKLRDGQEPTPFEQHVLMQAKALFAEPDTAAPSADEIAFLNQDLGDVDLGGLPSELTAGDIVAERLGEIDRAIEADAPLAVIFLVGSTIEGLLAELALSQPQPFLGCEAAPRVRGEIKTLDRWTLSELIDVSRALGVLGEDVAKHADQVRNFRNYIHPRQQLKENFTPRIETARIAQQVLKGVLVDLRALTEHGLPSQPFID